jgi:hypothetical protein
VVGKIKVTTTLKIKKGWCRYNIHVDGLGKGEKRVNWWGK